MTFSDIVDDLEALWVAALWFENRAAGFPESVFDVYRFKKQDRAGGDGGAFLASHGIFSFTLDNTLNVTSV